MIAAIVLAAGTSSRMGVTKQLLPFRGRSLVRTVAMNVLAAGIDEVLVVTGCQSDKVMAEIADLPLKTIYNPDFEMGQGTSLAAGAAEIDPLADIILVFMGDQPLISSSIIDELIGQYQRSNCLALRPVFNGEPGHPVIFDRSLLGNMLLLRGDEGARQILAGLGDQLIELPVPYEEVIIDVDTPEAYDRLKRLDIKYAPSDKTPDVFK